MANYYSQISRCISYHAPIFRPNRLLHYTTERWKICNLVCWQPSPVRSLRNIHLKLCDRRHYGVFTAQSNVDMLRKRISFSGAQSGSMESASNVVPVGILAPEAKDGNQLKIVIVPMDLDNQDVESLRNMLEALNQLRKHAKEIDTFTNNMIADLKEERQIVEAQSEVDQKVQFFEGYVQGVEVGAKDEAVSTSTDAVATEVTQAETSESRNVADTATAESNATVDSSCNAVITPGDSVEATDNSNVETTATDAAIAPAADVTPMVPSSPYQPNVPSTPAQAPIMPVPSPAIMPHTTPNVMPLGDPKESPISADVAEAQIEESVPEEQVGQISMEVPDHLGRRLNDMAIASMHLSFEMDMTNVRDAILNGEQYNTVEPSLGKEAMVFLETRVEADPENMAQHTVPLRFNALIKGMVQIDADKLDPNHLSDENLPEYNDMVTSIAASICSTALQRGFSADAKNATEKPQLYATDAVSTGEPTAAIGSAITQTSNSPVTQMLRPLTMSAATTPQPRIEQSIISPQLKDGCKHPVIKPKKKCPKKCPLIDDPCKEDPCKMPDLKPAKPSPKKKAMDSNEIAAKGGDPCAKDKKQDPCAKNKKAAKGGEKKDPCAKDKKPDPCAKDKKAAKGGEKKDPCAKDKKPDPCAKDKKAAKGGEKKDPCAKDKKPDPCAKDKKAAKGNEKKDPCAKDKKKDPCAKDKKAAKGGEKKDPCAKFKKAADKGNKDGGCKEEKKDPCKKKYSSFAGPLSKYYHSNSTQFYYPRHIKRYMSSEKLCNNLLLKLLIPSKAKSATPRDYHNTSKPAKFTIYSSLMRRSYGAMASPAHLKDYAMPPRKASRIIRRYSQKKKNDDLKNSKCDALKGKKSYKVRKDKKARTSLKTDCYDKYSTDCPKVLCTGKCDEVKFPLKKCDKSPKRARTEAKKKPKRKLPPICMVNKKKDSSKDDKGERNKLLTTGSSKVNQCRMHCNTAFQEHSIEDNKDNKTIETIRIPAPYQICRELRSSPEVKPFDVLIKTGSIALTGSDIHVFENANNNLEGMTLGHDATGFVEELGKCVKHLHVGDRVVMESTLSCGICDNCKRGFYNICTDLVYNGFLSTHQSHPADLCHLLPDSVSMEEGALTQTLAMGCQACFKAHISPTSNVLIIGSSPTAVAAAMCATAIGARKVTIAGTMLKSLQLIDKRFGFNTIYFDSNALFGEVLEKIYSKFHEWPNCAINCAISPMSMNLVVMALQPSSACVLAECETECASFNALDVLMKNIRLIPSFRSANMYPTAIQLMKSGRAPMHKLIAKTYTWPHLEEAFKSAQHESNVGLRKIIVNNAEEGGLFKKLAVKIN